jgi:hypothetical protein
LFLTPLRLGANYTVVTVSGIGSVGTGVLSQNPVYPDAGIALSTGTTWASSIPNNSTNWNTAFTDRLKWDGGSTGLVAATGRTSLGGTTIGQSMFTLTNPSAITFPRFNIDNTVTARTAANFRSDIGAGTVTSVTASGTAGNPISITNTTTTPVIELLSATTGRNGYLTSTDWTTFNNKQNALSNASASVSGILTSTDWTTFNNKQNALSNASASVSGILTSTDWTTFNNKQNALSNASASVSGILTSTDWTTFNNKQNALSNASASVSGILTSTDWTTFNNKQNALSNASASVSGILTSTDWTTFNNKQNALTNPVTGTGISSFLSRFTGTSTLDSTRLFYSSGRLGINMDASEAADHLTSRFVIRDFGHNFKFDGSAAGSGYTTTFSHDDTGLKIGQSSNIRDIRFTLNGTSGLTISNNSNSPARAVGIGNDSPSHQLDVTGTFRATGATTLGSTLAVTGDITEGGNNVLTNLDTVSLSSRIDLKQNILSLTTTGTSGAATLDGSTLNIPQYTGGSGTVTNVSGTGAISVINPTTTPVISVADAAFGTAGIVTSSGTQQFSGDKVFEGISQFNGRAVFKNYTYVATRLAGLSSTDRFATVTIGSGLSLSSGTLSATGAGVTSVTASSPLSSSGGATPNITITDAGAAASGVVNTTTQSFAGNKTFNSDIIVNGVNIGKGASSIASNTRVGVGALSSITTGIHNTSIGNGAGDLITTGESNTFLGSDAGFNITTGSYNTVIGHNSYPSANNGTLQLIIGHNLLGKGNYTAFIGGSGGAYNEKNVTTWETTSDIRLKKNIKTYNEGLNKINQIDVKNFEYRSKDEIIDSLKLSVIERSGIQIGVIAQEYKEIFPESVSVNSTGILSINTDNLIWHLVNSIKELSAELKILKIEIENLKK